MLLGAASEHERLSIYAPQARYNLPITSVDGREYVGLFELLGPLTTPELKKEGGKWKLRIPDSGESGKTAEAEFEEGSATARIRGKKVSLSAPARSENQRLLLPLHGVGAVLMPLLGTDLIFHEASRRMFIAGAAELISSEVRKGEPSTLALHFPEAVSPTVSSEGNSVKLTFTRDPVISFGDTQDFNDKLLTSSAFSESNGTATLTINGTAPLLARFADDGKSILIGAAPAPPAPKAIAQAANASSPPVSIAPAAPAALPPASSQVATPVSRSAISPAAFLVVIDAAHGGSDTGTRISPTLPEKQITLSLARKVREQLQARHIAADMLRDADIDLSLDQRAVHTNLAHPAVFISLHAEPGSVLRIYTPLLPSPPEVALERSGFLPWDLAQAAFSVQSNGMAEIVERAMEKRDLSAQVRPAFVQPLQSIAAPAIAIEAPADSHGLKISEDLLASALAEAVATRKSNPGEPQ